MCERVKRAGREAGDGEARERGERKAGMYDWGMGGVGEEPG